MQNECRAVLVTDSVCDWVEASQAGGAVLSVEKNPLEKAVGLLRENRGRLLRLLFILPVEELGRIDDFMKDFSGSVLQYALVAVSPEETPPGVADTYPALLEVRTERIGARELDELAERAFSAGKPKPADAGTEAGRGPDAAYVRTDLDALINIGKALSLENDTEKLLRSILHISKKATGADAGSIFLVEDGRSGERVLCFKYSHTFSKDLPYEEYAMPLDVKSIAGYTAIKGETLNIADVYRLEGGESFSFNPYYDKTHGYHTKSMLVVPMKNQFHQTVGVVELINCKSVGKAGNAAYEIFLQSKEDFEKKVVPFRPHHVGFVEAVAGQAAIALENNRMMQKIQEQMGEIKASNRQLIKYAEDLSKAVSELNVAKENLEEAYLDTIRRLVVASEYRDTDTGEHIVRMSRYSTLIARKLDLDEGEVQDILYAAPMHDVGKIGIPDRVLQKPGKLTAEEFEVMKGHTLIGKKILTDSKDRVLQLASRIAESHHEKWDGSGYPHGLSGERIPLYGRIVALADAFDALTTERPYKKAFSIEKACRIIREEKGRQFDPRLVDIFLANLEEVRAIAGRE